MNTNQAQSTDSAPVLIALLGAPGSGKSTMAARLEAAGNPIVVLSLDHNRARVSTCGDACGRDVTLAAVRLLHAELGVHLDAGRTVVVDATNADRGDRTELLEIAATHKASTLALVMATPLEEVLRRNRNRPNTARARGYARRVPHKLVADWHATILEAVPRLPAEGWDAVVMT